MATVVNTRDVQILATDPRVLGVQMNSNVQISQDNVTGLGIVVESTKQIWLASTTQVFQIPKSGSTTPSSVTLTANVRNLTATPTLSLIAGTMSVTPVLTAGVFTYTPNQQTSDVVTFRLSLTQDGKTYTDDLTVIKVREGLDSVTGLLTNENFSLPADYLGNVTSYAGCNGNFKVYQGSTDVTSVCTFTIPAGGNPDSLTVSLTGSGAGAGTYSITGGYPTAKDITTLTIRCTFGSTVIDKVMSIAKAKAGVNGATAKQLVMNVSAQSFTFNGDGVAVPSTQIITLFAASQNLSGSPTFSATGYNASGTSIGTLTLSGTGTTRTIDLAAFGAAQYAVVTVTWDGLTDNTTLVRLKDGAANVIGYLTNEAYTVATAADGSGGTYTAAGGTFKVFDGLTDMTGNAAVTYSVQSSSGVSISIAATGVYTVTGTTADQGNATLRAVYKGVTVDKTYTIARSKQGVQGANGSNGSNGQRGSRTFYVSIAGSTWSDATATTAASADGGPVINDIVCEFNNAANFSQTRFWTGSAWTVINAVVDGNLLVSGTVGAKAMTLNSGGGNNVWIDSNYTDVNAWQVSNWGVLPTQTTVTDGISGGTTLRSPTGSSASARGVLRVPVTVGKQYRVSVKARKSATANGFLCLRLDTGTARTGAYGEVVIGVEGVSTVPTSWAEYSATWTATKPFVSPMVLLNHAGTAGYMEAQDIRVEELMDSALIVSGGISADRIDSRGLSIKDALGNIILAAGSSLPIEYAAAGTVNADLIPSINTAATTSSWSGVTGAGKPEDNATVGATVGTNVKDGQGYVLSSSHLQKNLLDPSRWATGVDGWVNYYNVASVGNNTQYATTGCDGNSDLVWQAVGLVGTQYWMGGPQSRYVSIDPSKTYRYCIPLRRTSSNVDSHAVYVGIVQGGSNIDNINTTTLNINAYFGVVGDSSISHGKWYLLVGYIYPAGSTNNPTTDGGLFDCSTGEKVSSATSFNWHAGATTVAFRQGLHKSSAAATVEVKSEFGRPLFQVVDGSESPISDFFASTATYNKSISINSDGSLSGAGTGKVTLTGIGYAVDNDLISSVNCTVSGGRVTKSSGTTAWDSGVYSKTSFKGGAACSFVVDSLSYSFSVGLNSDPTTDNSYGSIDYAWYIDSGAGTASAWVNGVKMFTDSAFAVGDAYSVAYDGTKVLFSKNGTVKYTHTSGVAADLVLYLDTSFYHVGASASAVKFGGYTSNAWSSIGGAGKPADNATVGATIGTNLSGQFNSGNISTFFASAAIGLAQINTATITNLSALSATIGTLRTSTSGGRVEIMDNKIYVYDTSNALRVKIGYLL